MANYKRKKPRTQVKCTMCTSGRWLKAGKTLLGRGGRAHQPAFWPKVEDSTRD
jgi:hypothetical protein